MITDENITEENEARCLDMTHATDVIRDCGDVAPTLQQRMGTGGNQVPLVYDPKEPTNTVEQEPPIGIGRDAFNQGKNAKFNPSYGQDLEPTVVAKGPNAVAHRCIVRRLTPLETERLQGLPDGWTDIGAWTDSKGKYHKESSDSARYRAIGNSIAIPPWKWVMKRICANYERDATMGSLFSGIGGFDLIWTQLNGPNSVKWESEIEDFPIAVTKKHFGDEDTGEQGDLGEILYGKGDTHTNE